MQLVSYILTAMLAWVPIRSQYERGPDGKALRDARGYWVQEDQDEALARYEATARDIVSIALNSDNKPMFTGDSGRVKTALQLASIGSFEGGFHKWVENGWCNTPIWQEFDHKNKMVECDGGAAWSNWQIHMYHFLIRGPEMVQLQYLKNSLKPEDREYAKVHADEVIKGEQLVSDHKFAAQVAYYLAYSSIHKNHSLCEYSGEPCDGDHHPLAQLRQDRAVDYFKKHPFVYVEPVSTPPVSAVPDLMNLSRVCVASLTRMPSFTVVLAD